MQKVNGYVAVAISFMLLTTAGCANVSQQEVQTGEHGSNVQVLVPKNIEETESFSEAEEIAELYRDIYEEAEASEALGSIDVIQSIINRLGENGYPAVDSENQIDMAGSEQVMEFCRQVDTKEEAELTIVVVSGSGGFTIYDLKTENGNVDITQGHYEYENGTLNSIGQYTYAADLWEYTEEGYLLFQGSHFSEVLYALLLSDEPECAALRVQPLDALCRNLNQQYLLPIGYIRNNIFLSDWSENDYGDLDFYDVYDVFYPLIYKDKQAVLYTIDDDSEDVLIYRVPQEDFEHVVMAYFKIDQKTLRTKTTYFPEDETYEYKPRGLYESEYPDIPYPEVVAYEENSDGTLTLTVNAVYPYESTSKAYAHEVVIRPLADDNFQYVSNRMIPSENNQEMWWHSDRLTGEKWKEMYGGE